MALREDQPRTVRARPGISARERFNVSRIALAHPWTTVILWTVISIVGVIAFSNAKYALLPDITFPVVVVSAHSTDRTSADTEAHVTIPFERAIAPLSGISNIHSTTFPGGASIDVSFDVGGALESRRAEIAGALAHLSLPGRTTYTTQSINLNEEAIATYTLQDANATLKTITKRANDVVMPALRAVPGVLSVRLIGGVSANGAQGSTARFNGRPVVAISISKRASANTLEVADTVDSKIGGLRGRLDGITIGLAETQATYIREASRATTEALGIAMALAIVVIYPFLRRWRATIVSALAIPVSLLSTSIVMQIFHFNLETITLLALALVVGVILDDAIVDVENIVRHVDAGETPRVAAEHATNEIGLTVVAASLTIVAVFLPIGLMHGTLGQFFRPFGIVASAAVLSSLLIARTLSPVLSAWWLRPQHHRSNGVILRPGPLARITDRYRAIVRWALDHRPVVFLGAGVAFVAGVAVIPLIPKGFIPSLDRGEFNVSFTLMQQQLVPGSETGIEQRLDTAIRRDPAVSDTYIAFPSHRNDPTTGVIYVRLHRKRSATTVAVESRVRTALPAIAGVRTTVGDIPFVDTGQAKPLQVALVGTNLDQLRRAGIAFERRVKLIPGIVDVSVAGLATSAVPAAYAPIEHIARRRAIELTADLSNGLQIGDATDKVFNAARKMLPKGVSIDLGGNSADAVDTFRGFGQTFVISIAAVAVVLLLLFREWRDPIVIGMSLPLSLVGAMLALYLTRATFGMISLMGVVFLLGLVNKNAILLVDSIKRLRREGQPRTEAIVNAGAIRLRPIVMTTAATIFGMIPIALGLGAGAELRAPMAIAIIGGLITSTLLSLLVVPVAYTVMDDLRRPRRT